MRTNIGFILILTILGSILLVSGSEKRHGKIPVGLDCTISERTLRQSIDGETDTLVADDGTPAYVFRFPDVYGDDFRNQYFYMLENAAIKGVMFGFATESQEHFSTGAPDLVTIIWESNGDTVNPSLPGEVLLRDTTLFEEYGDQVYDLNDEWTGEYDQFVIVDLQEKGLSLSAGDEFHVGYTAIVNSPDDSLAILSDDATTSWESSEWYDNEFHYMRETWGGVNLMIRVIIERPEGIAVLQPNGLVEEYRLLDAYPNPFNSETKLRIRLTRPGSVSLEAFDILGRHVETLFSGRASGAFEVGLNAQDWTSGMYFVRLQTERDQAVCRIILEK